MRRKLIAGEDRPGRLNRRERLASGHSPTIVIKRRSVLPSTVVTQGSRIGETIKDIAYFHNEATTLNSKRKYRELLVCSQQAIDAGMQNAATFIFRAKAFRMLGLYQESVNICWDAINKYKMFNEVTYRTLGCAYDHLGEWDLAEQAFQKSEEIKPSKSLYLDMLKHFLAIRDKNRVNSIVSDAKIIEVKFAIPKSTQSKAIAYFVEAMQRLQIEPDQLFNAIKKENFCFRDDKYLIVFTFLNNSLLRLKVDEQEYTFISLHKEMPLKTK